MKTLNNHVAVAAFSVAVLAPATAFTDDKSSEFCSDVALGVTTDGAGRTLVVGSAYDNRVLEWDAGHAHYGDLAIARLLVSGELDDSFAKQGALLVDVDDFDELSQVVVHRKGIYAAGTAAPTAGDRSGDADLVVLAMTQAGQRRRGFGRRGALTLDLGGDEELAGLAAGPHGSLYLASTSSVGSESDGVIVRLTRHGELDCAFGDGGIVRLDNGIPSDRLLWIKVSESEV
jgi:hypothetical protein